MSGDDADLLVAEALGPEARIVERIRLGSQRPPVGVERLVLDAEYPGVGRTVVANGLGRGIVCFGTPHEHQAKRVALEVLEQAGVHLAPRVLAGSWHGVLLTSDLGDDSSVGRLLIGGTPDRAAGGLTVMAGTIGRLHAAADRVLPLWPHPVRGRPVRTLHAVSTVLAEHRFAVAADPEADIAELTRLSVEPKWCVLAYAAVMPGKVVAGPVEGRLFDFRQAGLMHLGWDAACFRMSFPASGKWWGVLPDDVIAAMERRYQVEAAQGIPEIADESVYRRLLAAGCALWALRRLSSVLYRLAMPAWSADDEVGRARLIHMLVVAAEANRQAGTLPALTEFLAGLAAQFQQRWYNGQSSRPKVAAFS